MSQLLDMQVYALLERLHAEQHAACRRIREQAVEAARALVTAARQRARAQVKAAVLEKRRRVVEHCRRVSTEIEASQRTAGFGMRRQWLKDALVELPRALEQRWRAADSRQRWCETILAEAAAALDLSDWDIAVAPGMAAAERGALAESASTLSVAGAQVSEDPAIQAGIVIRRGPAVCDGSVTGLMADRAWLESALLAEIERMSGARR